MKKVFFFYLMLVIIFTPMTVFAHVKWFTDVNPERVEIDSILSPFFFCMAILTAICLGLLSLYIPEFEKVAKIRQLQQKAEYFSFPDAYLKYGTALALIIQIQAGTLFAPEFFLHNSSSLILVWAIIGLLVIPNLYSTKLAALILLGFYISFTFHHGIFHMLDYSFYLGIISYYLLIQTKWERFKFYLLYMLTGFSLCWLAIEKWVYPSMTLNIIEQFAVPTFGFDPALFTIMAAFIEFGIGYCWIMGILNRLFSIIFIVIITLTTLLFGYTEFIGHFLLYIIMILFLVDNPVKYSPMNLNYFKTKHGQFLFIIFNFFLILSTFFLVYYRFA